MDTCRETLGALQNGSGRDFVRASVSLELVLNWLSRHGVLADVPSLPEPSTRRARHAPVVPEGASVPSFEVSAENVSAEETRRKADLFSRADRVTSVSDAELELEQNGSAKRFGVTRQTLSRIVGARRSERRKDQQARSGPRDDAPEDAVRYYGTDFKVSRRGVFARRFDSDGTPFWHAISTTPMDIEALTRDGRGENWGTYVVITDRDGGVKRLAIRHALIAADKGAEIAALLASLGVGVVPSKLARQLIVQFLTTEVNDRITSVPQIGWHRSNDTWVFVLPDQTLVPSGFVGPRPMLQTASLQTQHGLDAVGTFEEWINRIARPLEGNSNVHLCVGTAFAGPLLYWANEPPGLFHLWGTSKIAKSLAAAVGQSVWGRPKVPGEADAFGASWTATAVGLERYAVLRSDVGGSFDEIGEGEPKVIRAAVYVLANRRANHDGLSLRKWREGARRSHSAACGRTCRGAAGERL
jgi:hypothetical protein